MFSLALESFERDSEAEDFLDVFSDDEEETVSFFASFFSDFFESESSSFTTIQFNLISSWPVISLSFLRTISKLPFYSIVNFKNDDATDTVIVSIVSSS